MSWVLSFLHFSHFLYISFELPNAPSNVPKRLSGWENNEFFLIHQDRSLDALMTFSCCIPGDLTSALTLSNLEMFVYVQCL